MIANYFKSTRRSILKRKLYSFINVTGLSTGIAFCLLIYLFIRDEKSFDRFHVNRDRIFRLESAMYNQEKAARGEHPYHVSHVQAPLAPIVKEEIAEAELVTRILEGPAIVQGNGKTFNENITSVDADFFRIFSFPLFQGNATTLFRSPHEAVITQEIAAKYFGSKDPVGKTINIKADSAGDYIISGIIQAPPPNSSLDFDILIPLEGQPSLKKDRDHWGSFRYVTFVQLGKDAAVENFTIKLNRIPERRMPERLRQFEKVFKAPEGEKAFEYRATSLSDIHFREIFKGHKVSNPQFSWILGGIAFLILAIACINYISLALTSSAARRSEVGIRKVVGAVRKQLVFQFGLESILLALASAIIGIALAVLFLPSFNDFTGKEIRLMNVDWVTLCGFVLMLSTMVGVVSGSYPALYLSGFRPGLILKPAQTGGVRIAFIKPLVIFQFALSFFLVISAVIMLRQMNYIASKDLGYDPEMIVVIPTQSFTDEEGTRVADLLVSSLGKEPSVLSMTRTSNSFNRGRSVYAAELYRVDPNYIPTLGLHIIQGRNFDPGNPADKTKTIIVNEALVKANGWKDPLSETFEDSRIIGVVKDYHFRSLEHDIEPMVLTMEASEYEIPRYVLVKIGTQKLSATLDQIIQVWNSIAPDKPFEYSFLDEDLANQYFSYRRWTRIMTFSTGFAMLIAGLGLFGLAGINTVNRTREIGIRKVLGAGLMNIFVLVNRQYVGFALIAFAISIPFSSYLMNEWLANFTFRITPDWQIFALSAVAGILLIVLAVSYHGIKSALINPADTLKHE